MLSDLQWETLLERQRERESESLAEGAKRFRERVRQEAERGELSRSPVLRKLFRKGLEPVERAIRYWLETHAKRRGPRHLAARWISRVGVDNAAYFALKGVLDSVGHAESYLSLCMRITSLIVDELRYRRLKELAPALFEYKLSRFRTSNYAHMARSLDHAVRTARDIDGNPIDTSDLHLTPKQAALIGGVLVNLVTEATELVTVAQRPVRRGRRTGMQLYLEPTPETRAWLETQTERLALFQPQCLPMLVPPVQWAPGKRGGYCFALQGKFPLIRSVHDREHRERVSTAEMPLVYAALNSLQNTAWRVNPAVLAIVWEIEQRGGGMAGIPLTDDAPLPPRPRDIDTNPEARRQWRKSAGIVKDANHLRAVRARETRRTLDVAEDLEREDAFFFPYSLDFRGRIYPLSDYLHPQGNDLAKGLLTFVQGKPLDGAGARWLAIHGANCLGKTPEGEKVSMMTLEERVRWIHTHSDRVCQVANDPFVNRWWTDAEEPLQFYAFCVEWRNLLRANAQGESYVCSLPCSMDGTCNGLQHYSALLRDEVGGAAVNVVPQARPQDIYQRVADSVLARLETLAAEEVAAWREVESKDGERRTWLLSPTHLARLWLGLHRRIGIISRQLTKRPTMTFGYGSKRYGFAAQFREELRGRENAHLILAHFTVADPTGTDRVLFRAACQLMAQCIEEALGEVVVKAAEGMRWMQQMARGVVRGKRPVNWTVPVTGLAVKQEYVTLRKEQIKTILAGKLVRPVLYAPTDRLDPTKQANAVAPNIVHSLDAAALMLTLSHAADEGVDAFAMVHDSYGTVPADCELLARCTRQAFVELYSQNVAETLYQQFRAQYDDPDDCPPPPAMGALEVREVFASEYFFS